MIIDHIHFFTAAVIRYVPKKQPGNIDDRKHGQNDQPFGCYIFFHFIVPSLLFIFLIKSVSIVYTTNLTL